MNESEQHLRDFLAARAWSSYPSARVTFVAHRSHSDLRVLSASMVFDPEPATDNDAPLNVEVGSFVIHEGRYSQEVTEAALLGLAAPDPALLLPHGRLILTPAAEDPGAGWSPPVRDTDWRRTLGWTNSVFSWRGAKVGDISPGQEFWAALHQLPGAVPRSFADWNQVGEFVSPLQRLEKERGFIAIGPALRSRFDFHIPTYVRLHFGQCDAVSGALTLHVDARHLENEVSAVVRTMVNGNELLRFEPKDFATDPDCGHLCASAPLPPETGPVMCDLLVRGSLLERNPVGIPPSPVRLYSAIDPDTAWLDRLQAKAGKGKADSFEQWIHALFSLAGVPTTHFGHGQELFPDHVGWCSPNAAIASEVTLRVPDLNKLVELQGRVLAMRRALVTSVPRGVVFPAIFFWQAGNEVPPDIWERATQHGIALVTLERAQAFRSAVLSGSVQGSGVIDLLKSWGAAG